MEAKWILYSDQRPEAAGVYEWRMPSKAVDGLMLRVIAHHRKRGAGHQNVISPVFDYWDGYRVSVPAGLQWRGAPDEAPTLKPYDQIVTPETEYLTPCPFCGKVPVWKSSQRRGRSTSIAPDPFNLNTWWLHCCEWASTPTFSDPRKLVSRRAALLRHGEAA